MKIIDLTHPVSKETTVFPGDPAIEFLKISGNKNNFYIHSVTFGTHTGTHIDAPFHAGGTGLSVDASYILESCVGETLFIRARGYLKDNCISFENISHMSDKMSNAERIVLMTGWSRKYGDIDYYADFPSISYDLSDYLIKKGFRFLGVESPSMNSRNDWDIHNKLLGNNIILGENLNIPGDFPEGTFFLSSVPLRLTGLDGAPTRAYAILP